MKLATTPSTRIDASTYQVNGDDRIVLIHKNDDGLWELSIDGEHIRTFHTKAVANSFYTAEHRV